MADSDAETDAADRTEAATPRRLEKAREQGQVALSREAAGFTALLFASLAAALVLPALGGELAQSMRAVLERSHDLGMLEAALPLGRLALLIVLPVSTAAALGAVAVTLLQTRGLVSTAPLMPRLDKINPWAGLKRLVGMEALAELVRSVLKLGLVGVALWFAAGDVAALQRALHAPPAALLSTATDHVLRLLGAALAAFAAVAVLDMLFVRFNHLRQLRMSRQELRDEMKETEGDPTLRARRRQIRESRGRSRMMAEVPRAAVVITNPTHYAVALAYREGDAAPKVVAKGAEEVAARIRAAAEAAGVPLVSNPPLARALHRLDLGATIPAEHYQAVAEIIAFVWRRAGRSAGASHV